MKSDIEILKEATGNPNTVKYNDDVTCSEALTALATLRNEIINYHAFILMDNLAEIKKLGCSNSDDADMALDYFNNLLKKYK